jgi:type IV pilus assembly protein PilE
MKWGDNIHRGRPGYCEVLFMEPRSPGPFMKLMNRFGRSMGGFTLMELMITVAVVAILAIIAYPTYMDTVRKSRRSDAKTALSDAASRLEQYYMDNKTYTQTVTALGYSASPAPSPEGYYNVSVVDPTAGCPIATCYALKADPQGAQASDTRCATLTLNSPGVKGATGPDGANCW